LREEGVITTAVVVTGREEYGDSNVYHFLSLAYQAPSGPGQPERSFLREIEVSPKYYRDLPAGSAVPLRYIRTDPAGLSNQKILNICTCHISYLLVEVMTEDFSSHDERVSLSFLSLRAGKP
jgi:hypothetical protein